MPRAIEFDYDKAIDRATNLFWRKGYSQTSLRDLLKAMQIGEGSFYNTLKSKRQLFLECLKHYSATVGRKRGLALVSDISVKEGVRAFFAELIEEIENPKRPRACLMGRSISSDVFSEKELKLYVQSEVTAMLDILTERFEVGMKSGELPAEFEPRAVAQVIITYLQGLFPVALISFNRQQCERSISVLLNGLGL